MSLLVSLLTLRSGSLEIPVLDFLAPKSMTVQERKK